MGGLISEIIPGSIAEEIGLAPGDELLSINGEPVGDLIDYHYHCEDDYLELEVRKPDGEVWFCELEKYVDEDLGLVFSANVFDRIRSCRNHCLFCFIDQLQPQPRRSLLLKDDDYRMSFLEGNFITCTNLTDADYRRIAEMHISPLYISVHAVDPILRQKLLGRRQPAEILLTLQRLISLHVTIHAQVVLCPGINDGRYLMDTIDALYALHPGVETMAVVPVGLTRFQKNPELRLFTPQEARELIAMIEERQARYLAACGSPFVYAADELYVRAGLPFPPAARYGEFSQIENGVGMAARWLEEWGSLRYDIPLQPPPGRIGVVTGVSGAAVLRAAVEEIRAASGANLELLTVENMFYGPMVTATGLLTGSCLLHAIDGSRYDRLLLPANMLKFDEDIFLDDMTLSQLADQLGVALQVTEPTPAGLLAGIFGEQDCD